MSPLGLNSEEPANRTGPFMFARQTPSGPEAIQKLDAPKAKKKTGNVCQRLQRRHVDSQVLSPVWQPETKSSILILNKWPITSSFFFNSCDLCHVVSFLLLMAFIVVSQQPQDLISTPTGFSRGIFVWRVMAGNFNAQLIMSQNKWGSSSTCHSRWPVTWSAELWICQHHAGLLELMEAMASCRCPNLGIILGCFSPTARANLTFEAHV